MHSNPVHNDMGQFKNECCAIENNPHKNFIESLKKQLSASADPDETDSNSSDVTDEDAFSIDFIKILESKFNRLYADLNGDD